MFSVAARSTFFLGAILVINGICPVEGRMAVVKLRSLMLGATDLSAVGEARFVGDLGIYRCGRAE